MRLLHVTDTHLGVDRWFRGAPPGWRRADDHLAAFRAALAPAFAGEVDAVVHTGDVFDRSRPPPRAVAEAAALFAELGRRVPVVVMPGNHDRRGLRAHLTNPIPGVELVDAPAVVSLGAVRRGMVPYLPNAAAWGGAAARLARAGVDALCAHQAFDGVRVPGLVFRVGKHADTVGAAHLPAGVRHVLCGHIHPRQVVTVGEARVVHPGSTERTAFSERDETKSAAVWAFGAGPTWRWIDLAARPMHVVRAEADLEGVPAEGLVRLEGEARHAEIERAVFARGGWVEAWAAPSPQVRLFG